MTLRPMATRLAAGVHAELPLASHPADSAVPCHELRRA
jgi:hypothetical protein